MLIKKWLFKYLSLLAVLKANFRYLILFFNRCFCVMLVHSIIIFLPACAPYKKKTSQVNMSVSQLTIVKGGINALGGLSSAGNWLLDDINVQQLHTIKAAGLPSSSEVAENNGYTLSFGNGELDEFWPLLIGAYIRVFKSNYDRDLATDFAASFLDTELQKVFSIKSAGIFEDGFILPSQSTSYVVLYFADWVTTLSMVREKFGDKYPQFVEDLRHSNSPMEMLEEHLGADFIPSFVGISNDVEPSKTPENIEIELFRNEALFSNSVNLDINSLKIVWNANNPRDLISPAAIVNINNQQYSLSYVPASTLNYLAENLLDEVKVFFFTQAADKKFSWPYGVLTFNKMPILQQKLHKNGQPLIMQNLTWDIAATGLKADLMQWQCIRDLRSIEPTYININIASGTLSTKDALGFNLSDANGFLSASENFNEVCGQTNWKIAGYSDLLHAALIGPDFIPVLPPLGSSAHFVLSERSGTLATYMFDSANQNVTLSNNISAGNSFTISPANLLLPAGLNGSVLAGSLNGNNGNYPAAGDNSQIEPHAVLFNKPYDIAVGGDYIYISDFNNHLVRRLDTKSGTIENFAGNGTESYFFPYQQNTTFLPTQLSISRPRSLAYANDYLYISSNTGFVSKVKVDGSPLSRADITVVGYGEALNDDGDGDGIPNSSGFLYPNSVRLNFPEQITVSDNVLYIADKENKTVRRVNLIKDQNGKIKVDNITLKTNSQRFYPYGVAMLRGNLYISDHTSHMVYWIKDANKTTDLQASFLAGSYNANSDDGIGSEASFIYPGYLTSNNDFVLLTQKDSGHLRMITPTGYVKTLSTLLNIPSLSPISGPMPGISGLHGWQNKLLLVNQTNHRVLIFDIIYP